jgi:biotin-dependent carboxylase-like uncharacterized protein
MIEVLSQTSLATVQDLGRRGALQWGVGTAGAMDSMALSIGNFLVGNDQDAAAVELQMFPFECRLGCTSVVAVTGANCPVTLNGAAQLPWVSFSIEQGQVLRIDPPQGTIWRGARAYVCVAGGIDVPIVLNSRSTQLRGAIGGFHGRMLALGDRLPLGTVTAPALADCGIVPPALALERQVDSLPAVRAIKAAEHDRFDDGSVQAFWTSPWKITPQSDRYGFRLSGPDLLPRAPMELRSHGIVPGVIQVPHGGQPIIQMRDAQPSGGYPKIATVIEADLWRLGQAPIGSSFRIVETDWHGAIAALDENERWLSEAERLIGLHRSRRSLQ